MKILIVEDNITILEALKFGLEKEGFEVSTCENISQAKEKLINQIFSLVVLDIMLPDGDGKTLCSKIKERLDIPVIFLTAKDKELDVISGFKLGADDYIVKPFRIGELVARINNALRKYNKEKQEIVIGNVKINTDKMSVFKNDKEIVLTSLEWRILNTLLNSRGSTITREKLLNLACDIHGNYINDNSLTVYIKRIREN